MTRARFWAPAATLLAAVPAHAQTAQSVMVAGISLPLLASGAIAVASVAWAGFLARKFARDNRHSRRRILDLEHQLAETEALLAAEPHAMIVWEGREEKPRRVSARLHMLPGVPRDPEALVRFEEWLDTESAAALSQSLKSLRAAGNPFNISVHTRNGELLEADGRAAGYNIVLRFRSVFGERRAAMEMVCDTRRLGEQIERLSALLDSAPMPVWLRGDDGRLLWANRAWLRAVEIDDIDVAIARGAALVDDDSLEILSEDKDTGARRSRASTVIGGEKRTLEIFETRQEIGVAAYAVDVSEIENLRRELESHIAAHTSTLDKLSTAIAIFGPDKYLLFHNSAYAELWGLEPDWLAARPQDGEILNRLRDLRRLPEQADFRKWKEEQLAIYTSLEGRDAQWHLPDGRVLRVIAEPHPQGGVIYLFEDVTENIRLESRYNELINVQRETLDNLHEGVALFGTDGRLRLYNPACAAFWNLDRDVLESHPHVDEIISLCRQLVDDDAYWDSLKYCVTGMSDTRKTLAGRISRTDERVFDYVAVPLPDGNTLVTWFDMTASANAERTLRELNEALLEADRLKSGFLSSISYELRTPLTSIIGFSEALDMGLVGELNDKQKEYLRDISASSTDLLAIIDTILDLTSIDAGHMELDIRPLNLATLLEETAGLMADRLERRDLVLNIELAEDADILHADEKHISRILSNLLSNAIGFSDRGSVIHMGARRTDDAIELWVADEGPGMEPELRKNAFERFSAKPSSGGHRGPGLGLPLVKSLVELHGGSVRLISKVGKGTTVICSFPLRGESGSASLDAPAQAS